MAKIEESIYDTELESENDKDDFDQINLIGYNQFNKFNEYYDESENEEEIGFKIEETQNSIDQVINKKP